MQKIRASIITIGDELLIGQVIDTNSAWMAQELNKAGVPVYRRVAVGDNAEEIWMALDEESRHSDIILITGGLGPTSDDITKPLLAKYFNGKMIVDDAALKNVKFLFEEVFKRPITDINLKQAEVPDTCTVLQNKRGTAPGMWFDKGEKVFVSMPGVPYEMKGMMTHDVIPRLGRRFTLPYIMHKTLLTAGVGESFLAEKLKDFEAALPSDIKLAYLPSYGMVRLRLSTSGMDKKATGDQVEASFKTLQSLIKEYIVTNEDEPMAKVTGRLLVENGSTLATAESCTGGYIAHLITSLPGSSRFFKGSIISYSNEVKEKALRVSPATLNEFGAVSEETAKEMLRGVLDAINSDYAVAVSGIMGPDGGSAEKPVGTVWIAAGNGQMVHTQRLHFRFDRLRNIELTALNALNILRKFILADRPPTDCDTAQM